VQDHDRFSQADLQTLQQETFLRGLKYFEETDSTNTRALELLVSNPDIATPHLIVADTQLSGRGRGSNQWWSASGSLTFSVIINFSKIGWSTEQKPLLPLLTGLAILRTGQFVLPQEDFSVKWPNDVYLAGRKLAGILIEVSATSPNHAVVGIGLNVNNQFENAPEELRESGISLAERSEKSHSRVEILRTVLHQLENLSQSFANGGQPLQAWPEFCLLTSKQVTLQTGAKEVNGICHGIDDTGALLLETNQGQQRFLGGIVKSWD
jgi:BirA family biotin operon repressor/biotin-[acetyl-CoA-carboxylase] ligase